MLIKRRPNSKSVIKIVIVGAAAVVVDTEVVHQEITIAITEVVEAAVAAVANIVDVVVEIDEWVVVEEVEEVVDEVVGRIHTKQKQRKHKQYKQCTTHNNMKANPYFHLAGKTLFERFPVFETRSLPCLEREQER